MCAERTTLLEIRNQSCQKLFGVATIWYDAPRSLLNYNSTLTEMPDLKNGSVRNRNLKWV